MQATPQVIPSDHTNPGAETRLGEFAHHLANTHQVASVPTQETMEIARPAKVDLLDHLNFWEQALRNANTIFKTIPSEDLPVSRAGEWMLDNFYLVKQTFRQIEENLPVSFLEQLPKLNEIPLQGDPSPIQQAGLPRIFVLAQEWIGYSQSQLDLTQASIFIRAYQQITPLTIGELWAWPSMLRIGILEQLVYASAELTGMDVPKGLSRALEPGLSREIPNQFASPPLANETIVANCFLSLRLLSTTDWKAFFDQTSLVEQILRDDPAEIYALMDFETRNSYRNVVEELARFSAFSEEEVALAAVELARHAGIKTPGRPAHVGFYLRDTGRKTLETSIRYQPGFNLRIRRALLAVPTLTYLGSIGVITLLFSLGLLTYTMFSGGSLAQLVFVDWLWMPLSRL
jgi:cyclic beta-1,2-glucan synthetase